MSADYIVAKLNMTVSNSQLRKMKSKKVTACRTSSLFTSNLKNGLCANEHSRMYRGEIIQLSGKTEMATRIETSASAAELIASASIKWRLEGSTNRGLVSLSFIGALIFTFRLPMPTVKSHRLY